MQQTTARVDKQVRSLFDLSFWSSIAVIILVIVSNFVNYYRTESMQQPLVSGTSPQLVLVISILLILWLIYGCVGNVLAKKRLIQAYITLDDAEVSGYSLPNPTMREAGEGFSLAYDQIQSVDVIAVAITRKHSTPALRLTTLEKQYVVPAIENISEVLKSISERIPNMADTPEL